MGSKKSEAPAPVASPEQQAGQLSAAHDIYDPQAAQRSFNILANPNYGLLPTTQLQEDVRKQVFSGENDVRSQLLQNILANLQSPTGISPDQQSAITARRGTAQQELVGALRDRANLGGNLYGGRSALQESRAVGDLQNQFAEQDINRETQARQQAIQNAVPILQLLFPQAGITAPQFASPVQSPDTLANSLLQQRGQNIGYQQSQNNNPLISALFSGLGTAAGGFLGSSAGPAGTVAGSQLGSRFGTAVSNSIGGY